MSTKRYQRGIRSHIDLFGSEIPETDQVKKGRNEKLNEQRYERLCYRYYYYAHLKKMLRTALLQILEKEFEKRNNIISRLYDRCFIKKGFLILATLELPGRRNFSLTAR